MKKKKENPLNDDIVEILHCLTIIFYNIFVHLEVIVVLLLAHGIAAQ